MHFQRFTGLNLPRGFVYLDHPFIQHKTSNYVIVPDDGVAGDPDHPGGWKVQRALDDRLEELEDVMYAPSMTCCTDFIEMVTFSNPAMRWDYERVNVHADTRVRR